MMEIRMEEEIGRLAQLKHLRAEAELLSARIRELEQAAQGGAVRITGMPRGGGAGDRVGRYAAMIADLRTQLADRQRECLEELTRLYAFIEGVEDSLTRQVLVYRYVDGLSWQQVASALGEGDEQYPRRLHNRFLRRYLQEEAGR